MNLLNTLLCIACVGGILVSVVICISCCMVSGRVSRMEERYGRDE